MSGDIEAMQVAVRIRPLVSTELNTACRSCVRKVDSEPQVVVGTGNTAFTYTHVFDENDSQLLLYNRCIRPILNKIFEGYNVTVLAYGQTGSGKTYTMGTNFCGSDSDTGVIQRSLSAIFERIEAVDEDYDVRVSFLELYNETLYDLLSGLSREESVVELRDSGQSIQIQGLCRRHVADVKEAIAALEEGSSLRVTGATNMNATSSRSHAVFTISLTARNGTASKFHLVDLAGSERAKKTGAAGDRFREGVSINKGLLALGNVISQLSDGLSFVNYRDSLLTRLLRDSLGGNSYTLMIACIGPADLNQDETLSTLRYADRVLKIKNKPIINKDPLALLVEKLQKENAELKLSVLSGGGNCPPSHAILESQLKEEIDRSSSTQTALKQALSQSSIDRQRNLLMEATIEKMKERVDELMVAMEPLDKTGEPFVTMLSHVQALCMDARQLDSDMANHSRMLNKIEEEVDIEVYEELVTDQMESTLRLEGITKSLHLKQQLLNDLTDRSVMETASMERLEALVKQLMAEKAQLVSQLGSADNKKTPGHNKSIEEVQARLKQLEKDLSDARKRLVEQERLLKKKEKSDTVITNLKVEIQRLKSIKVHMINSMKADFTRFKTLQNEKNKEVCKLRSLSNRQSNQINRIQRELAIKQAVWRRKLEAAAAAKRKMEAALAKRSLQQRTPLNAAKVEEFIAAEVDVLETTIAAKSSLHKIMDDRAAVAQELANVEAEINESGDSPVARSLRERKESLQQNIDLQNAQISDLQQRILDSEPEFKRQRWDNLHSMEEARYALNCLFSMISRLKKDLLQEQDTLSDLRTDYEDKLNQIKVLNDKLVSSKEEAAKFRERLVREYEEKILLSSMEDSPTPEHIDNSRSQKENSRVLRPLDENTMSNTTQDPFVEAFLNFTKQAPAERTSLRNKTVRAGSTIDMSLDIKRPKMAFNFAQDSTTGTTCSSTNNTSPSNSETSERDLNTTFIIS